jgi:hypothetical protein
MTKMKTKATLKPEANHLYRITFYNEDTVYEIYAKTIFESDMFGFLIVEEFVFGSHTSLVVDPSEERLKLEFEQVKRTYIPMQSIIRIDEVSQEGTAKIKELKTGRATVSPFPDKTYRRGADES